MDWIHLAQVRGPLSIYLILVAALGPGSASNRNEYQKQKNYVYGEYSAAEA
jgi:hypothetical protein